MSAWDNLKSKAKSTFNGVKNGVSKGGAIGGIAGGVLGKEGLNDLLMGKKAKDINPDAIANEIRNTQSLGLKEFNAALNKPSADIVREQVTREKAGVVSGAMDARRNAQRMMAQTGLKGSSIGLALNRSIDQNATKDMSTIDARIPGAIRNQEIQDATTRINAGGINTSGMNFNKIQGNRSGGLLGYASALAPLAGTIGGAMTGSPQGAMMGNQMGQGVGQALARKPYDRAGGTTGYSTDYLNGNTGGY
jgi:hypothetical protein